MCCRTSWLYSAAGRSLLMENPMFHSILVTYFLINLVIPRHQNFHSFNFTSVCFHSRFFHMEAYPPNEQMWYQNPLPVYYRPVNDVAKTTLRPDLDRNLDWWGPQRSSEVRCEECSMTSLMYSWLTQIALYTNFVRQLLVSSWWIK